MECYSKLCLSDPWLCFNGTPVLWWFWWFVKYDFYVKRRNWFFLFYRRWLILLPVQVRRMQGPGHRLIIIVSYGVTKLQKHWLIVDLMLRILSVSIPIFVMFVTNNHTIEIDFDLKLSFKINFLSTATIFILSQ